MSRNVVYTLLYIWLLATPTFGQQEKDVIDDNMLAAYDKAIALNESHDYIEAFKAISPIVRKLDENCVAIGMEPAALPEWEWNYYWRINKSQAEIAYMLGNYSVMASVSSKLKSCLDAWKKTNGESDVAREYAADLAKIDGNHFYLTEDYDSAEAALNRALSLQRERLDYRFDFFYAVHDDLAQLYYKRGAYAEALAQLDTILMHDRFKEDARAQDEYAVSEKRQEVLSQRALCLARTGCYTEALKAIDHVCGYFKKENDKRAYAEALRKKAKILMLQYDETGKYSPDAISCYQQYLAISRDYIDRHFVNMSESEREQYWMAEQPFVTDCFRLEDKAPGLLYDVALYSKAVLLQMGRDFKNSMSVAEKKKALAAIRVNWQQVRDKLPASGCAIEFIVYEKKGQNHIGALVVNKKSVNPKFISLGDVTEISDVLLYDGLRVKDVFADTQNKDKINMLYNDSTLHRLVWNDAIVSAIGDCKCIYFSPDGIFHQMGIEYMTPPALNGKRLYRLTTTRLITQAKHKLRTDKMLACGGVEYGMSETDQEKDNDELAYSLLASMNLGISPLPHSAVEIDSIVAVRRNHHDDKVLRADSLTEAALTQLMGKYHIAHLSTHGLFSEVAKMGTDIRPSSTDTQLSKSCLFLSGAEKNLKDKDFDASQHDGVLSARELAKMNLEDVDLTVLSACMSGLGYITPDGVYGLQRGLKTAGVRTIISTLWSVDDEASCFFIVQLYKNLEAGMALHDAFWTARETLRKYEKTYGESSTANGASRSYSQRRRITIPRFDKPYYYNAFILIDGLE